jgi:DNA-binding HxlR family transcriptional regulator
MLIIGSDNCLRIASGCVLPQLILYCKQIKSRENMRPEQRSGCPINLTMEILGDRWSLIIIRDIMFGNFRHFRELQNNSIEGIASNILAARLKHLVEIGLLTHRDDPTHKQKGVYSLTEKSIELVPVLAVIGAWGRKYLPVSLELSVRAKLLEEGGPKLWSAFMNELRSIHLGTPKRGPSVLATLQDAFEKAMSKRATKTNT